MTEPQPSLPPSDTLSKRLKVIWRFLLISNFAIAAYMFASARKIGTKNDEAVKRINSKVSAKTPSTFMVDTVNLDAEKIPEDWQQETFQWKE